jgi:hypothetical protein
VLRNPSLLAKFSVQLSRLTPEQLAEAAAETNAEAAAAAEAEAAQAEAADDVDEVCQEYINFSLLYC